MKPIIFLIISIVYTKSSLSTGDIGQWEMFMFISGLMTFFWVTGIIQSLLPLYHRNKTYRKMGDNGVDKSPEIFNAFLLLCFFSLLIFILGHSFKANFSVFHNRGNVPFINLLLLYILLNSPVQLIEYIYLLNNRSYRIFQYGLYTFTAQLIFILTPLLLGKGIIWSIYGLLLITFFRWIWLIILLRRYTEMKISVDFIREHLYLGIPLIITTLISGSGQYIDGVIISAVYRDPASFAVFRYGAKEFPPGTYAGERAECCNAFRVCNQGEDEGINRENKGKIKRTYAPAFSCNNVNDVDCTLDLSVNVQAGI